MRVLQRRFRRAVLVLAFEELDQVDWSTVSRGCIYLDLWGRVHLELHHAGYLPWFHNTSWRLLLCRQDLLYTQIPARLLNAAKDQRVSELIGARQFIYVRRQRMLLPTNVGILSWDQICRRGYPARNPNVGEVRRHAYETLFAAQDRVAGRLGAAFAFMATATIDDQKLRSYGYVPQVVKGWRLRLAKWWLTFPLRNMRLYIKVYSKNR